MMGWGANWLSFVKDNQFAPQPIIILHRLAVESDWNAKIISGVFRGNRQLRDVRLLPSGRQECRLQLLELLARLLWPEQHESRAFLLLLAINEVFDLFCSVEVLEGRL